MDRGAWQATVHRVAKSQIQLSNWTQGNRDITTVNAYMVHSSQSPACTPSPQEECNILLPIFMPLNRPHSYWTGLTHGNKTSNRVISKTSSYKTPQLPPCSLLDHLPWKKPATVSQGHLRQPSVRSTWRGTEACCQQAASAHPCEQVILEGILQPQASIWMTAWLRWLTPQLQLHKTLGQESWDRSFPNSWPTETGRYVIIIVLSF